jgi:tetratricopeptide (TPR) repeat protein
MALGELGEFEEGVGLGNESLQLVTMRQRPVPRSMLLIGLGELYCSRGDFAAASGTLEEALELVRRYELHTSAFSVLRGLGYAYALSGCLADGLRLLQEAFGIAESLTHRRPHVTRVFEQLSRACLIAGRLEQAREHAWHGLERSRARRERSMEAYALRLLADVEGHANSSDARMAAQHYEEAIALATELEMRPLVARCHRGSGELLRRLGRHAAARRHIALATTMAATMRLHDIIDAAACR